VKARYQLALKFYMRSVKVLARHYAAECGRVRGDIQEQEWSWGKHFGDLYSVNM
jgi:hypothetical protein